ncbi:DUF554 domain-containing protein [Lactiplantibacillus plantarum]|uniref:DUF554 domain-containing protein n=1 Tax=Lactiplantibacillus plantarum TaxID=1590 RepID=UPI0012FC603F|nr:DUF554 domain-containing protein [Lactiplantibacillus plantarum]KAE9507565.1 putative membrane protein YdfK [Lactiplantibacillus plantarum]
MPIGIITNVCAIFFGGIVGALTGKRMSQRLKDGLNMSFGICSMCMGIYAIAPLKNLAAVIFAVIIGTGIGLLCHLGTAINHDAAAMQRFISRFVKAPATFEKQAFEQTMVTVIVLFCASGTGIYGTLTEGMNGNATILISKSILDFFAAVIFGANLGLVVSLIAVPQLIILTALFLIAHLVFPLTTPDMILDFKAVGGILMVASGFRIIAVKMFPTADMIPMMVVIMPISWLWMNFVLPLL